MRKGPYDRSSHICREKIIKSLVIDIFWRIWIIHTRCIYLTNGLFILYKNNYN